MPTIVAMKAANENLNSFKQYSLVIATQNNKTSNVGQR